MIVTGAFVGNWAIRRRLCASSLERDGTFAAFELDRLISMFYEPGDIGLVSQLLWGKLGLCQVDITVKHETFNKWATRQCVS